MPMVDKPTVFCRVGLSDLWDRLQVYVDFIETMGAGTVEECEDLTLPTNDEIEDAAMVMICGIYTLAPVARCIVPISPTSFVEVDCT